MVPIRLMIADDEEHLRTLLECYFESRPEFEVVAVAKDGGEALALALEKRPQVLLCDITMPVMDGLAVTKERSLLTDIDRAWLAATPFCVLATSDADGRCDDYDLVFADYSFAVEDDSLALARYHDTGQFAFSSCDEVVGDWPNE